MRAWFPRHLEGHLAKPDVGGDRVRLAAGLSGHLRPHIGSAARRRRQERHLKHARQQPLKDIPRTVSSAWYRIEHTATLERGAATGVVVLNQSSP